MYFYLQSFYFTFNLMSTWWKWCQNFLCDWVYDDMILKYCKWQLMSGSWKHYKQTCSKIFDWHKPEGHELLWMTPCISEFHPHCYDVSVPSTSSLVGGHAHFWGSQRGPSCSPSWGSGRGSQNPTLADQAVTKLNINKKLNYQRFQPYYFSKRCLIVGFV